MFLDKIMHQPLCICYLWEIPLAIMGSTILGGIMGNQGGGNQTINQQTIPTRPTLIPQEQALQNFWLDQIYGQIGQQSQLGNLINQYYGIPNAKAAIPSASSTAGVREQYEAPMMAQQAQQMSAKAQQIVDYLKSGHGENVVGGPIKALANKFGISIAQGSEIWRAYNSNPKQFASWINTYLGGAPTPATVLPTSVQPTLPATITPTTTLPGLSPETLPASSPLAQIMAQTPEQIRSQYDIMRQQGTQGIEDWYKQAIREAQMRATAQGGSFLGSAPERDFQALAANRGKQLGEMGQTLGLAEQQAIMQQPYQIMQALETLRQYEQNYGSFAQAPWIQAGGNILGAPWGQTTVGAQSTPGVGILPGAMTGLGMYGYGQQAGWWGKKPATSYGAGIGSTGGGYGGLFPFSETGLNYGQA
jgi:hypothetical protein